MSQNISHSTEVGKVMERPRRHKSTFKKLQKCKLSFIINEFGEDLINMRGKCIEIGCGSGDLTKNILLPALSSDAQIIATDILENVIKRARKTFTNENRLQFEVLDIETKNLPTKYVSEFDHVFSFYTLHWCNDIRQAFKNIYQMLRPNGTLLLYMIASHNIFDVIRNLARDIRFKQHLPDNIKNISPYQESSDARNELKELLQSIGFRVHHCSLRESTYFEEKESGPFLNFVIPFMTFLEDMPRDLREEFKNVLIYEYRRRTIDYKSIHDDQELVLDLYTGLVVYAQKI